MSDCLSGAICASKRYYCAEVAFEDLRKEFAQQGRCQCRVLRSNYLIGLAVDGTRTEMSSDSEAESEIRRQSIPAAKSVSWSF